MVVPRVPKRPGEVTGLGSNPGQGVVRRISNEGPSKTKVDEKTGKSTTEQANGKVPSPALPHLPETAGSKESPSAVEIPEQVETPPLLPRHKAAPPEEAEDISSPAPPDAGAPILRSDSAPPITAIPPSLPKRADTVHNDNKIPSTQSAPDTAQSDPDPSQSHVQTSDESPAAIADPNISPLMPSHDLTPPTSSAEDALRKLAMRDEDAREAQVIAEIPVPEEME